MDYLHPFSLRWTEWTLKQSAFAWFSSCESSGHHETAWGNHSLPQQTECFLNSWDLTDIDHSGQDPRQRLWKGKAKQGDLFEMWLLSITAMLKKSRLQSSFRPNGKSIRTQPTRCVRNATVRCNEVSVYVMKEKKLFLFLSINRSFCKV